MNDADIFLSHIIIYAVLAMPAILIGVGLLLRKFKKSTSKWLLIAGCVCIGLFFLAIIGLTVANLFVAV